MTIVTLNNGIVFSGISPDNGYITEIIVNRNGNLIPYLPTVDLKINNSPPGDPRRPNRYHHIFARPWIADRYRGKVNSVPIKAGDTIQLYFGDNLIYRVQVRIVSRPRRRNYLWSIPSNSHNWINEIPSTTTSRYEMDNFVVVMSSVTMPKPLPDNLIVVIGGQQLPLRLININQDELKARDDWQRATYVSERNESIRVDIPCAQPQFYRSDGFLLPLNSDIIFAYRRVSRRRSAED